MPTSQQNLNISSSLSCLTQASNALHQLIMNEPDLQKANALSDVSRKIDDLATALLQAKYAANDALFQQATVDLNNRANDLKAQEDKIKQIVADVGTAAQILGYIVQAATFIAAL